MKARHLLRAEEIHSKTEQMFQQLMITFSPNLWQQTNHPSSNGTNSITGTTINSLQRKDCDPTTNTITSPSHQTTQFKQSFVTLNYWKTMLSSIKHPGTLYTKALNEMSIELGISPRNTKEISEKLIRKEIKQASIKFQAALKNAHENRQKYLNERAESIAQTRNTSAATEIKKLISIERTIDTFQTRRRVFKNNHRSGLNYILYPKTNESGTPTTDKDGNTIHEAIHDLEDIEKLVIQKNIEHFGQAHGTPPMDELIAVLLGDGFTEFCQQVTDGSANTTQIPQQGIRQLLAQLNKQSPENIEITITGDDLHQGFRNWRESTTTSPSAGIDLGHWWRAMTYPVRSNDDHNRKSNDILKWHALLINEAVKREYVLKRWKTVHSCMIEKIPGYPLIAKLRVIHIFEADLNLISGISCREIQFTRRRSVGSNRK